MKNSLILSHQKWFKQTPHHFFFSPGRVNLIGEHVDYCGGHVLPMALSIGTYASVSKRKDGKISVFSEQFQADGIRTINLDELSLSETDGFAKYIKGMVSKFQIENYDVSQGLNIYIDGDLPTSAGLSSSASLELLIASILTVENDLDVLPLDRVFYSKYVENSYLGLSSGIMDQFAVAFGEAGTAVYLNTKTLAYRHITIDLNAYTLVMMNTNKARNLVESDYNARVLSIEKATELFKRKLSIDALCDVEPDQFMVYRHELDIQTQVRAEHVISENRRTKDAYEALMNQDYVRFGALMNASHDSLNHLYEVSCSELNYLVDYHRNHGALGARMTGAGFGGTMIALYETKNYPTSFQRLKDAYEKEFGLKLDILVAKASKGAHQLEGDEIG